MAARALVALAAMLVWAGLAAPAGGQGSPVSAQLVGETNGISIIQLTGTYDTELGGQSNIQPRQAVAQEFYRTHPDQFDFLVVFPNFSFSSSDGIAFHWPVRSSVQGIGIAPFDNGGTFGSAAQLQGFIDMPELSTIVTDPLQPGFEFTLNTLAHEILHQWGISVSDSAAHNDLLGYAGAHWSYLVDSAASVEYGAQWQDNGNGTFTAVAARRFYSPLDLYLAGFYDASEVPPFLVITSPGTDPTQLPQIGATVTGTGRMVSIQDILDVEGPRVPAAAQAQHSFKAAFIFVVRPGDTVTPDQLAGIDRVRREAMTHFAVLTGGRGTLDITDAALAASPPGSPTPVSGGPLRTTPASIPDALAWLRSQQTSAGFWQDTPATRPRDSAVVLPTLVSFDPAFSAGARQLAIGWLSAQTAANADELARLATTLGSPTLRTALAAQQNADGGWGLGPGYASEPVDTALAALALAGAAGAPAATLTGAGQYLLASQGADGGWGNVPGGASRTGPTAQVVEALRALGLAGPASGSTAGQTAAAGALAFLAARQNPDGGFGDSPSTAHDTAAALQAAFDLASGTAINSASAAAYLGTHQATSGSWEGSTATTAAVVAALQRVTLPNWTFSGPLAAAPAAPDDGDTVTITMTVLSNGDVATPAGVVRLYDGAPAAGGAAIGADVAIPPLPSGQTATLTATWNTLGKAGSHVLYAVIDPDDQTAELSKADNHATLAITVAAPPPGVDLAIAPSDISISPPAPSALPVQLAITAVVHNNGQTAAPTVDVRLYQGTPQTGTALGDVTVALPARSSAVANFVATLAAPGTTTYTVVADPNNLISEADKSNNSAQASVTTVANLDLGLAAADIQLAGPAYTGQEATFKVTFHNYGTVDAPSATVAYSVTDGTTTETLTPGTVILPAGGSAQESVNWRVNLTGNLTFTAQVQVLPQDSNPADNQASLAFSAAAVTQAEIEVGDGDLTVAPNPGLQGRPLTASLVVHNPGVQDVTDLQVGFYLGDPAQGGTLLAPLAVIPTVPAGGTATAAATAPSLAPAGSQVIYAAVDPNVQQSLFSRADLATFIVLPILSLPDAAITAASLQLAPAFPVPGQAVTLTVTVANLGQQSIPNLLVAAYDGDPAHGGAQAGTVTIPLLPGNGTAPGTITWTLGPGGNRTLFVIVDPAGAVVEASKANNQASLAITVQQGNFTVTNRYFSPNGDGVQDTTELDFRLGGTTNASIQIVDTQGTAVRNVASTSYTGVTGGSFVWDGKDDLGRVVADGDYVLRVLGGDGSEQGETVATVDTDHSPLFAALGTPYLTSFNLTCPAQSPGVLFYSADEQTVYFDEILPDPTNIYGIGIYSEGATGGGIQTIVPDTFFLGGPAAPLGSVPSQLLGSPDGRLLAFDGTAAASSASGLWTVATNGAAPPAALSTDVSAELLTFDPAGQNVIVASQTGGIEVLPVGGGAARQLFDSTGDGPDSFAVTGAGAVSPDHTLLAGAGGNADSSGVWIVDLAGGGGDLIPVSGYVTSTAWSPDSQQLAVGLVGAVEVFGRDGTPLGTFAMPTDIPDFALGLPAAPSYDAPSVAVSWSSDATTLAAQLEYRSPNNCEGFERTVTIDPATGALATVAYTQVFQPGCTSFHVSVWDGHAWVDRGALHFDPRQREHRLDLGRRLRGTRGELRLRIRQTGASAATVDRVSLLSNLNRQAPTAAHRLADGRDVRAAVAALDGRTIDLHEAQMEVVWNDVLPGRLQLSLDATEGLAADQPPPATAPAAMAPAARAEAGARAGATMRPRDAATAPVEPVVYPLLTWAPNQLALALFDTADNASAADASTLFDLVAGTSAPLLPQIQGLSFQAFSPAGRYMLYSFDESGQSNSCEAAAGHTWALASLQNLTADLQIRVDPASGAEILSGTAADLHFASYQLDYENTANPGVWTPIAPPSSTPVVAGEFTAWVPPGPGSYVVRLTVRDLAGNSRTATARASSSTSPFITDLSLTPRYISPNGDGVDDTADIHYTVLQPVHLSFVFYDANANPVRTITADDDQVGESFDLTWDGTSDAGTVVPDGDYTMKVLGYQLPITVATQPPAITLGVTAAEACIGNPSQAAGQPPSILAYAPAFSAAVKDAVGLASVSVQTGVGAAPADWEPAVSGQLTAAQFENHSFRVLATDVAGNSAQQQVAPGPQQLFLSGFGNKGFSPATGQLLPVAPISCVPAIAGPGPQPPQPPLRYGEIQAPVRIQVSESVLAPMVQVFVDTQPAPASGTPDPNAWVSEPIATFYPPGSNVSQTAIPNTVFEMDWDLQNVTPGVETVARVRTVDVTATTWTSQLVQLNAIGAVLQQILDPLRFSSAVGALLTQQDLDPPRDPVMVATTSGLSGVSQISLIVTSTKDPRFNAPQTFAPVANDGTNFIFTSPEWQGCIPYQMALVVTTLPQIDPATGATVTDTITIPAEGFEFSCVALETSLEPVSPAACDAVPATARVLDLTPHSLDGTPLQLLTLSDANGIFYSVSNPTADKLYQYDFDTASTPAGTYTWQAQVTNIHGDAFLLSVPVTVEHTPPTAAFTYPLPGRSVCGIQNRVVVRGTVQDALAVGYRLTFQAADGSEVADSGVQPSDHQPGDLSTPAQVSGALGAVGDVAGTVTAQLKATNPSGWATCAATSFTVDAVVSDPSLTAGPQYFSPNGDGVDDTVTLTVAAGEPAHAGLSVVPAAYLQAGPELPTTCTATGAPPVRQIVSGVEVGTPQNVAWDGEDDNGATLADGVYQVIAGFTDDDCGNHGAAITCLILDNTPPVVAITYPSGPADPLGLVVEVQGTANDLNLASWSLEVGAGSAPQTWATLATRTSAVIGGYLGSFNTFGLTGLYTLRLTAVDLAGNTAQTTVQVNLANLSLLITDLEAQPRLFSPNGDGRLETTNILWSVGSPVTANLTVQDAGGNTVRTLLAGAAAPAGSAAAVWNGRNDAGTTVADGTYSVVLSVASATNAQYTDQQAITVQVDGTLPQVTVTRPAAGGWVTPTGSVLGAITDPTLTSWSVAITSTPQAPAWTQIATGSTAVTAAAALASLSGLTDGQYALKVDAADAAQNQTEQIIPFGVISTPPQVTLAAPAAAAVLGAVGGVVPVAGTITDAHLQSWTLQLGAGAQPATWTTLATGTTLPLPSPIFAWSLTGVASGSYVLRLEATDLAAQTASAQAAITIDNTPPVVAIATPAAGAYVTGPMNVIGTAADANLVSYQLAVASSAPGAAQLFSPVGSGTAPVTAGALASWTALPPDGPATLQLTAVDKAGNQASTQVQVNVHTHPPAAPQGVAAQVSQQSVHLSWLANSETDLAGYRLLRNGAAVDPQQLLTGTAYVDAGLSAGTYTYTLVAVDQEDLASAPSAPAQAVVDPSLPTAILSRPAGGSRVGGVVSIVGTAEKLNDFAEYRVYVTPLGSAPPNLLRTSPLAVVDEELAEWDTTAIPDNSALTIRLEAQDLQGNVAAAEITVTTDNTPPAAPTGLTATAQGTGIQVAWNPNTESDLAGYLLYRNGQLVDAVGAVVGDLTPYLLQTTSWSDANLPDGTFVYVLYALDTAGNQSAPSAPAQASLDNHPPHVVITQPAAGTAFQSTLDVVGTSADLDIASVQFQWQAAGGTAWTNLGAPLTAAPWEVLWDASSLAYGNYLIQAVATDTGGATDPAPAPIAVAHQNLVAPPAPAGLAAAVAGGTVTLTWSAATPPVAGLAGYLVTRTAADGTATQLTPAPIAATTYADQGLAAGTWSYTVTAVNTAGNASQPAGPVTAVVYAPVLAQPYTPTAASSTALAGSGAAAGAQVAGTDSGPAGSVAIPAVAADGTGSFAWNGLPLALGTNVLTVTATDASGNVSQPASVHVVAGAPPAQPTGLTATAATDGTLSVALAWNPNPAADQVIGYRLLRDGADDPAPTPVDGPLSAGASSPAASDPDGAPAAIDGDETTFWVPEAGSDPDLRNQWLEVDWPAPRLLIQVQIDWAGGPDGTPQNAGDFDLQGWDGSVWVPLAQVRGASGAQTVQTLPLSYLTGKLRLQLLPTSAEPWVAELRVYERPLTAATAATDAPANGNHSYQVVAVGPLGLESQPSAAAAVAVANAGPPAVTLAGAAVGASVGLTWTASADANLAFYQVLREGTQIATVTAPTTAYTDTGRPNGTWHYTVVAVDTAGNAGPPSNTVAVTVAVAPPPAGLAPVLTFPAISTLAFATTGATADLAGTAAPGATVVLTPPAGTGGTRSTQAAAAVATADAGAAPGAPAVPSPDGRYLLLPQTGQQVVLYDFQGAGGGASLTLPAAANGLAGGWLADGSGLLLLSGSGEIDSYRFAGAVRTAVATMDWVASVAAAPDGLRLAAVGSVGGQSGLWIFDPTAPAAAGWTLVAAIDPSLAPGIAAPVWSPEGSWLAYLGPLPAGGTGGAGGSGGATGLVVVQTAAPNAAALVEANPGSGRPGFTPDGSAVAFTQAQAAGGEKVRLATVGSGAAVDLTDVEAGPLLPQLSPDGTGFAYAGVAGLMVAPLAPFAGGSAPGSVLSDLGGNDAADVAWVPGGYLVADAGDELRIAPAGRFTFAGQQLQLGPNTFTATATDAAGNVSAPSAPRQVDRLAANLPDLAIAPADMAVIPAAPLPGQALRISATVHNQGPADAPATTLALTAYGPGGAQVQLAAALAVPAIPAGSAATLYQDGAIAGPVGAWTLAAQIDPQGLVQELRKDNDQAQIAFQVVAAGPPTVAIATDQASYQPSSTVTASVTVWNGSAPWSGQAVVTIEDSQGNAVTTLPALAVGQLAYGQRWTQQTTWNTGATFAGSYLADVKLEDGQGSVVAEAVAPFTIVTVAQLTAAVATDSTTYPVGASVHVTAQVGYPTGDAALTGVAVHLQVLAPAAAGSGAAPAVLGDWTRALGTLLPGGQGAVSVDWPSGTTAAGTYQVAMTVLDGGQAAAAAGTQFSLTAAAAAVTGTLSLNDRAPSAGSTLAASYGVTNPGAALAGVAVRVRVLDAASGHELARQSATLDLGAGATVAGSASFDTTTLGLGGRLAVLEADLPAAGGSGGGGGATQTVTLAVVGFTIYDRTPPAVTITQPAAGAAVGGAFQVIVTVRDPLSAVTAVAVSLDGGAWQPAAPADPTAGTYRLALTGVAAGAHTLTAQATDAAGNSAQSAAVAVTVSSAPPVITITGVAQGGLYDTAVTPVVTITAATATYSATVTLDGQPFTSGTAVAAPGSHTLAAAVTDAAGNQASASVTFTIDTTPPAITITGVAQGGLYNTAVTPVVTVTDAYSATQTITLNGQPFASGTAVTAAGSYTLAVTATDAAGNQASASVTFAIDKTPPVISVTGVGTGGVYGTTVTPVVTVTDSHPGTQTITLNGQTFTSGTPVSAEGSYTLAVSATDAAGNQSSLTVTFALDKTPPVITVGGVTNGATYTAPVTPVVTVTDAHPGTVTATLNGQPFVSGTQVSAAGNYQLQVAAVDAAGNQSQAGVSFAIEAAAPPALTFTKTAALLVDADGNGVVSPGDTLKYTLTLTNTGGPANAVTVTDAIPANTNLVAGSITASQGTVAGQNPVQVTVGTVLGSAPVTITFQVVIANPLPAGVSAVSNQASAAVQGLPTLLSDDPSTPQAGDPTVTGVTLPLSLSVADTTVTSPASGSVPALFPVSLSAPAPTAVSVQYAAVAGTAAAWVDFLPVAGTLTFSPGTVQQDVLVPVLADPQLAGAASFNLQLSQPQGAALARGTALGTIQAGPACASPNLLANPGAELPTASDLIPDWDLVAGTTWQVGSAPPAPFAGDDDFLTQDAAGEIKQDVDLSAWAQKIASAGGQTFAFQGALLTGNAGGGAAASTARIVVEYRDAANVNVLGSYDSGWTASAQGWLAVADQRQAPAGTGWVRVRLLSQLPAGGGGTAWFDGLSLVAVETPALAALDAAALSPAAGQSEPVVVQVKLSCAASQAVTVHYATVDDTAVAGTDYQTASGTLTFAPGTVEQSVQVTALGIAGDTVDRQFQVVLTQPAGAAVAKSAAQVVLLPRPFCPQPPAYWRHHLESWTASTLTLGGVAYGQGAVLGILGYAGNDPLWLLAQQLAATTLDLAAGGATGGQTAAANADAFLAQHAIGTTLAGSDPQTAASLTAALVSYDSGTCPLVCSADPLGAAGRFNLFALGNVTQSGTDTQGRLAAGGNATLASYSVGQSLTATGGTDDVLIAGGSLSFNGGTVSHGNAVYGSALSLTSVNIPNGTARHDQPLDFAGTGRALTILSTYWSTLAANGTTTVQPWKAIQLAGTDPTLNVFSVHGSDLAAAVSFSIQVPAGSTALVNVNGTADQMQNFGFQLTGVTASQVVYNFYQATTLSLSGIGVPGTVLAPRAAVTFSNGNINGSLVGASVSGGGQSNESLFTGCLPVGH